jgi:hypothetical protein
MKIDLHLQSVDELWQECKRFTEVQWYLKLVKHFKTCPKCYMILRNIVYCMKGVLND